MRNTFIKILLEQAKKDKNIILLVGDLGFGVLDEFQRELSGQFINAGISEQNMMSMAAGLALRGKKVFVYSIGNFPGLRCVEQLRNDVLYHDLDVNIISVGAGFAYGALGMSHHSTEDIAMIGALPNIEIYAPCDRTEAEYIAREVFASKKPKYIRLGKGNETQLYAGSPIDLCKGAPHVYKSGKDILFAATGDIAIEAKKATEILQEHNMDCGIISIPVLKPLDAKAVADIITNYKLVVTIEEHNVCGLGSNIADIIADNEVNVRLLRMGLRDAYASVVGDQQFLRHYYGIDADGIVSEVKGYYFND